MSKENMTSEAEEMNKEEVTAKEVKTENVTEEVVNEVSEEEKLQAEVQELKDKYLRLYSEFENYRRRTSKERLELIKTASVCSLPRVTN